MQRSLMHKKIAFNCWKTKQPDPIVYTRLPHQDVIRNIWSQSETIFHRIDPALQLYPANELGLTIFDTVVLRQSLRYLASRVISKLNSARVTGQQPLISKAVLGVLLRHSEHIPQ